MSLRTPAFVVGASAAVFLAIALLWVWGVPRFDRRARGSGFTARTYRFGVAGGLGVTGVGLALVGLGYLGTVDRLTTIVGRPGREGSGGDLANVAEAIPASELGGVCIVAGLLGIVGSLLVVVLADVRYSGVDE